MTPATLAVAAAGLELPSQTLWWLNRATGIVLLVQLTVVVMLGIGSSVRALPFRMPVFVTNELHRKLALMTLSLLVVHIVTAVLDSFVDISWLDSVVPFLSPYRTVWLGLGTLAVDLIIAAMITTALRPRLSERAWRATHALTYPAWAIAVLHGLGTGTDVRNAAFQIVTLVCVVLVVAATAARLVVLPGLPRPTLVLALVGLALLPTLATLWAVQGPFAPGWSKKAGTPPAPAATVAAQQ